MPDDYSTEIWKPIAGYPGREVSNMGQVRSFLRCGKAEYRILRGCPDGWGYTRIKFGRGKGHRVHRLVAEAFLGPIPPDKEVNHIDSVKTNNRRDNLEVITHKSNVEHAYRAIRAKGPIKPRVNKLSESQVREIRALKGKETHRTIARTYGVCYATVYNIWNREIWKHVD